MDNFRPQLNKKLLKLALLTAVLLLAGFGLNWLNLEETQAASGINTQLNYQGKLTTTAGVQVSDGNWNFRFRIYDASSGGNLLWTERWTSTTTQAATVNGIFSVTLGSLGQTDLLSGLDWNSDSLYLQVDLDADNNGTWEESFDARKRLTSSAYAFNADMLDGYNATTTAAASGTIPVFDANLTLNLFDGGVSSTMATSTNLYVGANATTTGSMDASTYCISGTNCITNWSTGGGSNWQATSTDKIGANLVGTLPWITPTSTSSIYLPLDLYVNGSATTSGILEVMEYATTTGGLFTQGDGWFGGSATSSLSLYIGSQLNVATTSPWADYELAVLGDGVFDGKLLVTGSGEFNNVTTTDSLSVNGYASSTSLYVGFDGQTSTSTTIYGGMIVDTDTLVVNANENRVGIGTSTPNAALQVVGGITQDTGLSLINRVVNSGRKDLFASGNSDGLGSGAIPLNTWMTPSTTDYIHGYGDDAFRSGVFDGQNIWLAPYGSTSLVKVNPATGAMTAYAQSYGSSAFCSAVFDGQNIWLVPYGSDSLVKVNPATGAMTAYAHSYGLNAFRSGVFDGQNIWLVPYNSDSLVKVNPATGAMTNYAHSYGNTAFFGGVFDGQNVWLIPFAASSLVKIDPATGAMTNYAHSYGSTAFAGGVFDGQNIWLVPFSSTSLVKVNPQTGAMTAYAHSYGTSAFTGGVFDGQNIWLVPFSSASLVKVNPQTGAMTAYAHSYGAAAFLGGVFDGQNIWLIPSSATSLVKVHPQEFGAESLFTTGVLNVGGYLQDRATLATSTINGSLDILNGLVGFSTTTAKAVLTINPTSTDSIGNFYNLHENIVQVATSTNQNIFMITNEGKVGISTSTPSAMLAIENYYAADNSIYVSSGAALTIGGVWTDASSAESKENFVSLDNNDILNKILGLPLKEYNYISEPDATKHFGATAEDWYANFGLGNNTSISGKDTAMIALAGIQALSSKIGGLNLEGANASLEPLAVIDSPDLGIKTLAVGEAATFYGTIYVHGEAEFESKVVFNNDLEVRGKIYASSDQAGTAVIPAGAAFVDIAFAQPYESVPKITITVYDAKPIFYGLKGKTASGFKIVLAEPFAEDLTFDWIALGLGNDGNAAASIFEPIQILGDEFISEPDTAEPAIVVEPPAEPIITEPETEPTATEPATEPAIVEPAVIEPAAEPAIVIEPVAEPIITEPAAELVAIEPPA